MNGNHLKLLKELSENNTQSQRELSQKLGVSLGSVNYVLSNLLDAVLVRAKRFKNSKNKIAYISDKNNGPQIWAMNPDGSNEVQVTLNGGMSPCWSPDGQSLIFVEGNDIFTVDLRTKEKIRLTYNFSAYFPSIAEIKNASPAVTATEGKKP